MSSFDKHLEQFCQYSLIFKGNRPRSVQWLKSTIKCFQRSSGVDKVENINRRIIEDWIYKGKFEKDWSAKTIRNKLTSLSLFFKWCIGQEIVKHNPVLDIPKPKLPKRLPVHLEKEDAYRLLEFTKYYQFRYTFERFRAIAIIAILIFTGIRHAELRGLNLQMSI